MQPLAEVPEAVAASPVDAAGRTAWRLLRVPVRIGVGAGESVLASSVCSRRDDASPRRRLALALAPYGGASGIGAAVSAAGGALLGYGTAQEQRVTPNNYRGRACLMFLLFGNLIGFGPLVPAAPTDHAFPGPEGLGWSIALTTLATGALAALLLWCACAPMRAALRWQPVGQD